MHLVLGVFFTEFSYHIWRLGKRISTAGLTENNLAQLMQDLGLAQFVFKGNQRCSSSKYPFIGATDNWKNGKADLLKDCCSKMELLLAKYIHFKKKSILSRWHMCDIL